MQTSVVALLQAVANAAIIVFVLTSMLSVGFSLTLSQIVKPLRSSRVMLLALVANFIIVPIVAWLLARLFPLPEPFSIAIMLLGTGAGAPFLPKLAQFARGDCGLAVALMIVLMGVTIAYMPIALPLLIPTAHITRWHIAKPLLTLVLTPLAVGLFVRARLDLFARYFEPYLRRGSTIALIIAIILVFGANANALHKLTINAVIVGVLLLGASLACGFMLGGPSLETKKIVALGTAQRDLSAALIIAVESFSNTDIVVMLLLVTLLGLCIQLPLAIAFGRRATAEQ